MKTLITSVCLLVIVIVGVITSAVYTSYVSEELTDIILLLNENNKNTEEGRMIFESVKNKWEDASKFLTLLYDYREIKEIEMSIINMDNSIKSEIGEEFMIFRGEFLYSIERLKKISEITIGNIV